MPSDTPRSRRASRSSTSGATRAGPARKLAEGSHLHDHTAYWLNRLAVGVLAQFERRLSERGVTVAQWKVLIVVYRRDVTTPFGLSKYIDIDSGAVTRVIDRLIAKDLMVRKPSASDGRSVEIELTKEGGQLVAELVHIADEEDQVWLSSLSPGEVLVFKDIMAKLLAAQGVEVPEHWRRSVAGPPAPMARTTK